MFGTSPGKLSPDETCGDSQTIFLSTCGCATTLNRYIPLAFTHPASHTSHGTHYTPIYPLTHTHTCAGLYGTYVHIVEWCGMLCRWGNPDTIAVVISVVVFSDCEPLWRSERSPRTNTPYSTHTHTHYAPIHRHTHTGTWDRPQRYVCPHHDAVWCVVPTGQSCICTRCYCCCHFLLSFFL